MSKNHSAPAFPVPTNNVYGLNKLEAFTMAAMQGLCANPDLDLGPDGNISVLAAQAVEIAKKTLDALEKPEGGENDKA